ncbi:hypothetical protein D9M68_559060 [compost metagenome]
MQERTGLVVEGVELVLGKIADHQVLATLQTATDGLQLARQILDQGRLAGAVRAEQTQARTGRQLQLELLQYRLVSIAQAGFGEIEQRTGDLVRLAEAEIEG